MDECQLAFRFLPFYQWGVVGCHISEQEGKLPKSRNYSILFRLTVSQVNYEFVPKKGQVTIEIDCCHRA